MPPKILVFGTGSIGAVYAYILSKAIGPSNVVAVCRSNYAAAMRDGFTINSTLFGQNLNVRPHIVRSVTDAVSSGLGPFTHIVICTKAIPSTPSIPDQIKPAVTPSSTSIILIQNGIAIEKLYSTAFPTNPLLSCVTYLPATQTAPAVISHVEVERLHIGTYPSTAPASHKSAASDFATLIEQGGATALLHDDIQTERWSKLLVNASWNPICALSRSRDADFLASSPSPSSSSAIAYIEAVMSEIALIARAAGYPSINADLVTYQLGRAQARTPPGVEPSMLADALAGRRMEVDAIVGNAVRIAEEKVVSGQVPHLKALEVLVRALDAASVKANSGS